MKTSQKSILHAGVNGEVELHCSCRRDYLQNSIFKLSLKIGEIVAHDIGDVLAPLGLHVVSIIDEIKIPPFFEILAEVFVLHLSVQLSSDVDPLNLLKELSDGFFLFF